MAATKLSANPLETPPTDQFAHVRDILPTDQAATLWAPDGNVLVADKIAASLREGYDTNPIVDPNVSGLGQVCLTGVRQTGGKNRGQSVRTHRMYTIERQGFSHAVEVTDPARGEPAFTILSLPGFTETIEGPVRKLLHTRLTYEYPQARVASVGSNGIGSTGDRFGWNERSMHSIAAMGSQRLALGKALAGDQPVFVEGTSMGSVISHRLAKENFFGKPENGSLNLVGLYWLSPALVDPKNTVKAMGLKFVPGMAFDTFKELTLKTAPLEAINIVRQARKYGVSTGDFLAMTNQVFELFKGTPEDEVSQVLSAVPAVVVAGEKDSLAQWPMMHRLAEAHPDRLRTHMIEGRGHSLALKPGKACAKLASASRFLVERAIEANAIRQPHLQVA